MTNFAASFKLKQHEKVRIIIVGGVTIGPIRDVCRQVQQQEDCSTVSSWQKLKPELH